MSPSTQLPGFAPPPPPTPASRNDKLSWFAPPSALIAGNLGADHSASTPPQPHAHASHMRRKVFHLRGGCGDGISDAEDAPRVSAAATGVDAAEADDEHDGGAEVSSTSGTVPSTTSHVASPAAVGIRDKSTLYCPCCNTGRPVEKSRRRYIGRAAVAAATCISATFDAFLDCAFPIVVCRTCSDAGNKAVDLARWAFPSCAAFATEEDGRGANGRAVNKARSRPCSVETEAISCNGQTLRVALEKCIASSSDFNIGNLPVNKSFAVGEIVTVQRRTAEGINKPGGAAAVTARYSPRGGVSGALVYDVKYIVGSSSEKGLPVGLLSAPVAAPARRASGSSELAAAAARRASDADAARDQQDERHRQELEALKYQAAQGRSKYKDAAQRLREAVKEAKANQDKVRDQEVLRTVQFERMHANVDRIAAQVAEAAVSAKNDEVSAKMKQMQSQLQEERRQRLKAEEDVKHARNQFAADQARTLSNVGALLDDSRAAATAEAEEKAAEALKRANAASERQLADERARHESELSKLQSLLYAHGKDEHTLMGIARQALSSEKYLEMSNIPSLGKLGSTSDSVEGMHPKRKSDLARVATAIIGAVLEKAKAGKSDPSGVLKAMLERRSSGTTVVGLAIKSIADKVDDEERDSALAALASSWRIHQKMKDTRTARQILSIAVGFKGASSGKLIVMFSSPRQQLSVGDKVVVVGSRRNLAKAVVQSAVDLATGLVKVSGLGSVDASRVWLEEAVRCTEHQIHEAKLHAAGRFPGAQVPNQVNGRVGIDPVRAAFVAEFLRSPEVVEPVEASFANAAKGVKYRLKARRWVLWHRLVEVMGAKKLKPASWGYFWMLTGSKQYELLTSDNCCCGICRELGFDNFDELRDMLNQLDEELLKASSSAAGLPTKNIILKRVQKNEEFLRGSYLGHLEPESDCGHHCLTHLLSTSNDSRFRKPCTHPPPATGAGAAPLTMAEEIKKLGHKRQPRPSDWNDTCEVCSGSKEGNALMCDCCNVVAHSKCVECWHWDLPETKEEKWNCPDCQRSVDSQLHSSSCDECAESERIILDIKCGVELLQKYESEKSSSSGSSDGGVITAAASEILRARLQIAEAKLEKYMAHLIRDRNQSCFKDLVLDQLPLGGFYLLVVRLNCFLAVFFCCCVSSAH